MRNQLRAVSCGFAWLVVMAVPATASVDLNGIFHLTIPSLSEFCRATFTQNGTTLDVTLQCVFTQAGASGTIDPMTGAYSLTGGCMVGPALFGTMTMSGITAPDSASLGGVLSCPPAIPGGPYVYTATRTCPNGMLDALEDCDDGNFDNDDSCSNFCQGPTMPCDDGDPCTRDVIAPLNGCIHVAAPAAGCSTAEKSLLFLQDSDTNEIDKLEWKWLHGAATTQDDFGVPTGTTSFSLCIYAGSTSALITRADVPPDASKWRPSTTKGWLYKDLDRTADGIYKLLLRGGDAGRSRVQAKGKGENLPELPAQTLPIAADAFPVTVQLFNDTGRCWGSDFAAGDVKKNTAEQFKARHQTP